MLRTPATIISLALMGLGLTLTPISTAGPACRVVATFSESFSGQHGGLPRPFYTVTSGSFDEASDRPHRRRQQHHPAAALPGVVPAKVIEVPLDGTGVTYRGSLNPSTWRRSGACGTAR